MSLIHLLLVSALSVATGTATLMPSPSCMLNNESCPIPRGWVADWSVINSTAMLSAAESPNGFYPVNHWGYVTLDWQAGYNIWLNADPKKTTCEATNAANCLAIKKSGKVKRCGIYHNMELALEWLQSNRLVMDQDHVDLGWFLKYTNGSVFNHQIHAHAELGPLLNQWFIDWRNPDAAAYFAEAILNATFLPGVDATFTDDLPGVPAEHPEVQPATNMSNDELAKLQFATQMGENYVVTSLAIAGKFCWDCVGGEDGPEGSSYSMNQVPPPNTPAGCARWFRYYCAPEMQGRGMFMDWACTGGNCTDPKGDRRNQTLAAFLITRGPYAFIGSRSLRDHNWHPLFATDVGEPLGLCSETAKNVFRRVWSKGVASLDCNTYTADLPFSSLNM
eukprot:m.5018 g.5018  ORF g.5018 m.5018 type:complete len:391 (-) comp3944_c0_seq1:269-1441(-)